MKKTLKMSVNIVALMGVLALALTGCTSSGGSSSSGGATTSISGSVAKGYVKNAIVIADKIDDDNPFGNHQLDTGEEQSLPTDEDGDYDMELAGGYGDYVLFSSGGTDTSSGRPAPPMMAPGDVQVRNITPVTTMVTQVPALRAKIGEDKFGLDIAAASGADGSVVALAMVMKGVLEAFDENVGLSDSQKLSVISAAATSINSSVTDFTSKTQLVSAFAAGAKTVAEDTTVFNADIVRFDGNNTSAAISDMVTQIVEVVDPAAATVVESVVKTAVDTAIGTGTTDIGDNAITSVVKINIGSLLLQNSAGGNQHTITSSSPSLELTEAQAEDSERIVFTLVGKNTFGVNKNFENVSLIVKLRDFLSLRTATATISGLDAWVYSNNDVVFVSTTDTMLTIAGIDSEGTAVNVTLENISSIVAFATNSLTINMDELGTRIEAEADAEALWDIGMPGEYTINMSAAGVPLVALAADITVN